VSDYLEEQTVNTAKGPVLLVRLISDRLKTIAAIERCKEELRQIDPGAKVVVDLQTGPVVRSVILSGLLCMNKATRLAGGRLCLCNLCADAMDVLRILNLDKLPLVKASRKDAIWALSDYPTN